MYKQLLKFKTFLLVCILAIVGTSVSWGQTTYRLVQVTSVEAEGLYVFEQNNLVMDNKVNKSGQLTTTSTYSTSRLTGTETYVWTLETAEGGFYMKNASLKTNAYLNNNSGTDMSMGSASSIWAFNFQSDGTVLIQNTSNANRFLGFVNSSSSTKLYKAYATGNLSSYDHDIVVYKLVEPSDLSSIAISGTPTTFFQNDSFSSDGITVTATYKDGETQDVTSKVSFSGYDMSTTGTQTVTVSYTENSITKTATYEITVQVIKPAFSVASGSTVEKGSTVELSQSKNQTIRYTTDGTTPTTSSDEYTDPIAINAGTTIKAIAIDGTNVSEVAEASYTLNPKFAFSEESAIVRIGEENSFPMFSNQEGFDGVITFASSDESVATIAANGTITLVAPGTTTISATSEATENYAAGNASYSLKVKKAFPEGAKDALFYESFDNLNGTGGRSNVYYGSVGNASVSGLTDETWTTISAHGAYQCYKLGTSSSETICPSAIPLTGDGVLTFEGAGWAGSDKNTISVSATGATLQGTTSFTVTNSKWNSYMVEVTDAEGSVNFTFSGKRLFFDEVIVRALSVKKPAFSVGTGTYTTAQNVTLSCITEGATIQYALDEGEFQDYTGAIAITKSGTVLRTKAIKDGEESLVNTATYTIVPATPVLSLSSNTYTTAQSLTVTKQEGTTVYYTTDGSTPTAESSEYTSPLSVTNTATYKAIAFDAYGNASAVASATYTIKPATPELSLSSDTYTSAPQSLTITHQDGTTVYYTTDGNMPTAESNEYTSTLSVTNSATYKAVAIDIYGNVSDVASATYTIQPTQPTITQSGVVVTISSSVGNIAYTTDGSTPLATKAEAVTSVEVIVNKDITVKAIAVDEYGNESAVASLSAKAVAGASSGTYTKVTTASQLEAGKRYLLIYENGTSSAAFAGVSSNNIGTKVDVSVSESTISDIKTAHPIILEKDDDYWNMKDVLANVFITYNGSSKALYTETNSDQKKWTITISNGGVTTFNPYAASTRVLRYNSSSPRFCVYGSGQQPVALYKEVQPETGSFYILAEDNGTGYGTFYNEYAYTMPTGVTGNYVSVDEDKKLVITSAYSAGTNVPAKTPLLLTGMKRAVAYEYTIVTSDVTPVAGENLLIGSLSEKAVSNDSENLYYRLTYRDNAQNALGFYFGYGCEDGHSITMAANKAYLRIPAETSDAVRGFAFVDAVTGIKQIESNTENNLTYDLQGRRVSEPKHGLYIINGKKTFIK